MIQVAEALLVLDQSARAREQIDRALARLAARGAPGDELADVQFLLARVLPATDAAAAARAGNLAAAARSAYAAAGPRRRADLAAVQTWLDAHPSARMR